MNQKFILKFSLVLGLCILCPSMAQAKTEFCGAIEQGVDWTLQDSPIHLTNDVFVTTQGRLSIEAGVVVILEKPKPCKSKIIQLDWADSQFTSIKVDGSFFIKGTPENPVLFKPAQVLANKPGWYGIYILNKSRVLVRIEGGVFENAHKAVISKKSQFVIKNSLFQNNNIGVHAENGSHLHLYNNLFTKNLSAGIYVFGSNPIIENNLFYHQIGYGIWSDSRLNVTIRYNGFWKNPDGHCYRCPASVLRMTQTDQKSDSLDEHFNLIKDPIFFEGPTYLKAKEKDLRLPTPLEKTQDVKMGTMQKEFQKKYSPPPDTTHPRGKGPFRLSYYSPFKNKGNPASQYNDTDGSRNDMGLFGSSY